MVGCSLQSGAETKGPTPAAIDAKRPIPAATYASLKRHKHPTRPHYRLLWHDEFTGTAGGWPNGRRWIAWPGAGPNQELEYFRASPDNVSLDGHGHLAIRALRQDYASDGRQFTYTSGRLTTLGHYQFEYGRIEARIKIPAGQGLWPAFWGMGTTYPQVGWPDAGELDTMEMQGGHPKTLVATMHGPATHNPDGWQINAFYHSPTPLQDAFHVYELDWSANKLVWRVDGHAYGTVTRSELGPGEQWVFSQQYFLILTLSVGGYWPGLPTASTHFPATMLVDWVRVYA